MKIEIDEREKAIMREILIERMNVVQEEWNELHALWEKCKK